MNKDFNEWYYTINNKLIKEKKPCLPGDLIHLHDRNGCHRVMKVTISHFMIEICRQEYWFYWDKFKCLKGEGKSAEAILRRSVEGELESLIKLRDQIQQNIDSLMWAQEEMIKKSKK